MPRSQKRKSRGAPLLLLLLLIQAGGWFFAWQCTYRTARRQASAALSDTATRFDTLLIAAAELPALRVAGKHEIRMQGRLYDIAREKLLGDSIELVVYHDRDEERVLKYLSDKLAGEAGSGVLAPWWAQWLAAVYLPPDAAFAQLCLPADRAIKVFILNRLQTQHALAVRTPPPAGL